MNKFNYFYFHLPSKDKNGLSNEYYEKPLLTYRLLHSGLVSSQIFKAHKKATTYKRVFLGNTFNIISNRAKNSSIYWTMPKTCYIRIYSVNPRCSSNCLQSKTAYREKEFMQENNYSTKILMFMPWKDLLFSYKYSYATR